jgi:hypothetical protein
MSEIKKYHRLDVEQRTFIENHIVKKLRVSILLEELNISRATFKRARFGLPIPSDLYFKLSNYLLKRRKQINNETDEIV